MYLFLRPSELYLLTSCCLFPRFCSSAATALGSIDQHSFHPTIETATTHTIWTGNENPVVTSNVPLFVPQTIEWNARLKELVKNNWLHDARHLFETMPVKDMATWTILISAYVASSRPSEALILFSRMFNQLSSSDVSSYWSLSLVRPDPFILSVTLKACGLSSPFHIRSRLGRPIHGYTVKCGLGCSSIFVSSALLDMYAKAGMLASSVQVFNEMHSRNVVTWTAMITALARDGCMREAIHCFSEMRVSGVECDSHTFAIALKACADSGQIGYGKEIHAQAVRIGFDTVPFVANSLATLYRKCGKINTGLTLFELMRNPDVVSWTTMISTLSQMGREEEAVQAFLQMLKNGGDSARPNEYTFAAVISAFAGFGRVTLGEQLHAMTIRFGVAGTLSTSNATITMYSRSRCIEAANMVFLEMTFRDVVSWSAIISAHGQEGNAADAFRLFSQMLDSGIETNDYVLASLLSMCAQISVLEQGQQLHGCAIVTGLDADSMVSSTMVNMYSKCGCLQEAQSVFSNHGCENVVSWTSMINGYANHGHSKDTIRLFDSMRTSGMKPDSVTFIGVLSACSHAGLLDLGFKYFDLMQSTYGINPEREHFGCMVDLLCRAGKLDDAEKMIENMPFKPDDVVWSTLLQASRIHGNAECGRHAAEKILELHSDCAGTLITLSNLYAAKGRWKDAADVRLTMKSKGVRKEPGWSWITVAEHISVFAAGDRKHPRSDEIYKVLYLLSPRVKVACNLPGLVTSQIEEGEEIFTEIYDDLKLPDI